jgi:hypothetical protein
MDLGLDILVPEGSSHKGPEISKRILRLGDDSFADLVVFERVRLF